MLPVRGAPQVKGKKKYVVKKGAVAALRFALCINGKGASNTYMDPKEKIPAKVSKYRKAFFSFILTRHIQGTSTNAMANPTALTLFCEATVVDELNKAYSTPLSCP